MNQDFHDLLSALCATGARFLIVGAYAVSFHAEPRATGALDVWVEASPENAPKVLAALRAFGAPLHDLTETDLARPDVVFQMGLPPRRIATALAYRHFGREGSATAGPAQGRLQGRLHR